MEESTYQDNKAMLSLMPRTEICGNDASRPCYDGAIIQGSYGKLVMTIQGNGNFFTDIQIQSGAENSSIKPLKTTHGV
ncbi:hypothetical protein N9079_02435 [bacterium]|nr:hypothetical protein [bacterium]